MNTTVKISINFALIAFISFLIGWSNEQSYLNDIGANWAIELLSTQELIRESMSTYIALVIGFFIAVQIHLSFNNKSDFFRRIEMGFTIIAMIFFFSSLISFYFNYIETMLLTSSLASYIFTVSCAFTFSELAIYLEEKDFIWNTYLLKLVIYIAFIIFYLSPEIASYKAKADLDIRHTNLKAVCLDSKCSENWHLVRSLGNNFLIINLNRTKTHKEFRIVPITELTIFSK